MDIKKNYQKVSESIFDVENNIISIMLHDKYLCEDALQALETSNFSQPKNKVLFEAIKFIFEHHQPIDLITIKNYLSETGKFDFVGENYLLSLVANFFSTNVDNFEEYLRIIVEKEGKRKLSRILKKFEEKIDSEVSLFEIINDLEEEISKVNFSNDSLDINELGNEITPLIEELKNPDKEDRGVPSGLSDLDKVTGGFWKEDLIIVASRPSVGKTALAVNFMLNVANYNAGVVFFSLEMSKRQLIWRMIGCNCRFNLNKLRNPSEITSEEWQKIEKFEKDIIRSKIHIDNVPGLTLTELKIKLRRLMRRKKIKLVIIDHLQLLRIKASVRRFFRFSNRQEEISYISSELKTLARELKVPIICLAQLSRSSVTRDAKRPIMSDLRDSGALEQDSDLILLLWREDYHDHNQFLDKSLYSGVIDASIMEIIISKQRNGSTGTIETPFKIEWNRFGKLEGKLLDLKEDE